MAMRLAPDPILVRIGGEGVTLSPSLRAAMRIARKHKDFQTVLAAIMDGNLTVMADLLEAGGADAALADLVAEIGAKGLGITLWELQSPLAEFVLALAGLDPDAPAKQPATSGQPIGLADYHTKLFEVATGWLGWPPAQAWAATPAEIEAAFKGRTDMLRAIFGGADKKPSSETLTTEQRAQIEAKGMDPEFNRAGLHALKSQSKAT
jgi:hypothetical protein